MQSMFDMLNSLSDLDGALFEEQRTFRGIDKRHYEPFRYYTETCPVEIRAIFEGKKALIRNFIYRKPAFEKAGGYPEHHDFDTQGFALTSSPEDCRAQVAPGPSSGIGSAGQWRPTLSGPSPRADSTSTCTLCTKT